MSSRESQKDGNGKIGNDAAIQSESFSCKETQLNRIRWTLAMIGRSSLQVDHRLVGVRT